MYKFVKKKTKAIVFFLDFIGFIFWILFHILTPWKIVNRKTVPIIPKKILLIRADYIGDVLLTTHTLKGIRHRFPESHIVFLVSSKSREILEYNPYIDNILTYDPPWFFRKNGKRVFRKYLKEYFHILSVIRKQKFDLAVDFRGDARNILLLTFFCGIPNRVSFASSGGWYLLTSIAKYENGLHEAEYHSIIAETLGVKIDKNAFPQIFIEDKHRVSVNNFLNKNKLNSGSKLIIIHPGARRVVRQWPEKRYAEVGRYLIKEYGAKIILTGSLDEMPLLINIRSLMNGDALIASRELTSIKQLKALFEICILYIGISSGPSHIAAAANLPSILIFGPESISQWRPLGNKYVIIKKQFPCSPCNQKRCPRIEDNCIKAVQVSDVIEGIKRILVSGS